MSQNQKTPIAQLPHLPAECPVVFTEGVILKVFNRRSGINPTPPNRPFAFQEVLLGEVDNPTITFPCQVAGAEFSEITKDSIGTKVQFVSSNHNGKPTGVKIKADPLKPEPGQPRKYRNVLHITPTAAVVGINVLGGAQQPAAPAAVAPPAPAPVAQPQPKAPVNPPAEQKPLNKTMNQNPNPAPQPQSQPAGQPTAAPVVKQPNPMVAARYFGKLSKLLAMSARAVDNANEIYAKLSKGNQFSQELRDSATTTFFLSAFKDYGRTAGLDAEMPPLKVDEFVALFEKK